MEGETVQINEQYGTPQKKGIPRSRCKIHVHFLGYDNMRAWVTDDNVMPFEGKSAYDELAKKCPKHKEKDYYPTKKYQRLFEKGVKVAEDIEKLGLYARLKKLGLIYVPVPVDDDAALGGSSDHPVIPKIPSGGGFFKSYTPVFIPKPEGSNKTSLDIFDFDENELDSLPIEFRKNEDQKPTTAKSASTPSTTKNSSAAKSETNSSTPKSASKKANNTTKTTSKQTPKSATKKKTPAKEPAKCESESSAKTTPKSSRQTSKSAMKRKMAAKDSTDVESEKSPPKKRAKKTPSKTPSKTTPKSTPKRATKKQESIVDPSPKAKAPVKRTPGRKPKTPLTKMENGTKTSSTTTTATLKVETASDKKDIFMKDLTATTVSNEVRSDEFGESDDETSGGKGAKRFLLGSLVWGRMPGFPYWPCFITKSPSGVWKKAIGRRHEYHAQFFNWNNESGWISNAMPWCSVEDYHKEAKFACPKGPNTPNGRNWYPPSRLAARWKGAVFEAQKTVKMSRRIRYSTLVAHYVSEDVTEEINNAKPANATPDVKKNGRKKAINRHQASKPQRPSLPVHEKQVSQLGPASKTGRPKFEGVVPDYEVDEFDETPCPASKKRVYVNGLPMAKIEVHYI